MKPQRTRPSIEQRTLANGLRVSALTAGHAPLVGVNLWYGVGSRDESPGRTGFAHLFEHLMFQGSGSVAAGEHSSLVDSVGGSMNGTTSFGRTNYYEVVPRHAAELALWLEADRMGTLLEAVSQENLDNQRDVVKNERRQSYENAPYGDAWESLLATLFPAGHPHHHLPIGSMADLDAASLEDVTSFFTRHYTPANAVLTVVGDVEAGRALDLAEQQFGGIVGPAAPARRDVPVLGALSSGVRVAGRSEAPLPRAYASWRVRGGERASLVHEIIGSVLGGGHGARLTRPLTIDEPLAHSVGVTPMGLTHGDEVLTMVVTALPGSDLDGLLERAHGIIRSTITTPPTAAEMALAKARLRRHAADELSSVASMADQVSEGLSAHGDARWAWERLDEIEDVTSDEVVAGLMEMTEPSVTLTYEEKK